MDTIKLQIQKLWKAGRTLEQIEEQLSINIQTFSENLNEDIMKGNFNYKPILLG